MASAILGNMFEKLNLRTNNSLMRLAARKFRKLPGIMNDMDLAFKSFDALIHGDKVMHEDVRKVFKKYFKEVSEIVALLEGEIRIAKKELNDNLTEINMTRDNLLIYVRSHPQAAKDEKVQKLNEEVKKEVLDLEKTFNEFLKELGSFQSLKFSSSMILKIDSQAREGLARSLRLRKEEKRFHKASGHANDDMRKGNLTDKDLSEHETAHKNVEMAFTDLTFIIEISVILLREMSADIHKKKQIIMEYATPEGQRGSFVAGIGYPWAEEEVKKLDKLSADLLQWVKEEIDRGRIFFSDIQHKAA
ncbi:hypothetical protein GOV11_02315 [Candidatus Woesearchaeota archaeon]|nr:hypothetical protein [Candidatus Woesearchaeota archaeon]